MMSAFRHESFISFFSSYLHHGRLLRLYQERSPPTESDGGFSSGSLSYTSVHYPTGSWDWLTAGVSICPGRCHWHQLRPRRLCTAGSWGRSCDTSTFLNMPYLHSNPPLSLLSSHSLPPSPHSWQACRFTLVRLMQRMDALQLSHTQRLLPQRQTAACWVYVYTNLQGKLKIIGF